jgi:riboflavin kinase/FMN adenylyltransferase
MKIFRTYNQLPSSSRGASVALGNFDGVHLGHRGVISRAAEEARNNARSLGVVTFEPHPVTVLRPEKAPRRLAPFRVKVRRLRECGVQVIYMLPFSREFSQKSAEQFVGEVLVENLNVCHVVVGHDYRFGRDRLGDYDFLARQGKLLGFGVTEVSGIGRAGEPYSSTRVRNCLQSGEPRQAAAILGHMWEIEGRVLYGDARGRKLGYPTANIAFKNHVVPAYGIYAVWCGVLCNGSTRWYPGIANVGIRPMFRVETPLLEVHLFDYNENLYGTYLRVAFLSWIRSEQVFENIDLLVKQMDEDCRIANLALAESKPPIDVV